jgi:hypothetical protein
VWIVEPREYLFVSACTCLRLPSGSGIVHELGRYCARAGQVLCTSWADCSSTRFIIFDKYAKIVAEHQTEFPQILPHAGWHEQDPQDLVDAMVECINKAVEKLEWMGWKRESIKGIGGC